MHDRLHRDDYCVSSVPLGVCQQLVARYHYARGGPNTATFRHGLFQRPDALSCLGVAWWIPPTRAAAEASWDGDWRQVIALSRLVIAPGVPKNAASFLIAQSVKLIRQDGRFRCLITYADTWQGHTGAIYRATNWEYLGLILGDPTYLDDSGRMVARQTGGRGRTQAEMVDAGCASIGRYYKHKFRMVLPEPRQKAPRMQYTLGLEIA